MPTPTTSRAPNRVLDLDELERAPFRSLLSPPDALVVRCEGPYLHRGSRSLFGLALVRA